MAGGDADELDEGGGAHEEAEGDEDPGGVDVAVADAEHEGGGEQCQWRIASSI